MRIFVLQASAEWSQQHMEDAKHDIEEPMLSAFFHAVECSKRNTVQRRQRTALYVAAHRWHYAICDQPLTTGCLIDKTLRIAACCDWCLGNNVEAAFLSGLAAADGLLIKHDVLS